MWPVPSRVVASEPLRRRTSATWSTCGSMSTTASGSSSNKARFLVSYSMNQNMGDENSMKRLMQASTAPSAIVYFTCGESVVKNSAMRAIP